MEAVYQKSNTQFVFKFSIMDGKNEVISQGTWYFDKRPLLVSNWGSGVGENKITELPIWIKLSNVPGCYWTEEGLGHLASVIGRPLGADALTSRLNIIPFARMCVQYKVGEPLPDKIKAVDINPVTREKTIVEVNVSYQQKPKYCLGCKSLGHLVSTCPTTIRKWVMKPKQSAPEEKTVDEKNDNVANEDVTNIERKEDAEDSKAVDITEAEAVVHTECLGQETKVNPEPATDFKNSDIGDCSKDKDEGNWKTVQSRKTKLAAVGNRTSEMKTGDVRINTPIFNALARSTSFAKPKRVKRPGGTPSSS